MIENNFYQYIRSIEFNRADIDKAFGPLFTALEYKTLNEILADKFEGIRLRLKTMKEKGIVDFEGIVPSFNSKIRLTKD